MEITSKIFFQCCLAILISFWNLNRTLASRQCPNQEAILPCRCLVRAGEFQIWCTHSDLPSVLSGLKSIGEHIKDPIDELILENNYLPSLPGRTFSSLRVLRLMLRQNGLERVSSDWLTGLETTLVEVFLVEPHLRSIPDDAFSKLNSLQAVTIQTKLLKHLPIFSGLVKLRYVQIESESLLGLSPLNFKDNINLEKIHISSSPVFTKLEANTFVELPKLELINITTCGLDLIHVRSFARLPALKQLLLNGNKIVDVGMVGRAAREIPSLELIRLDNNYIDKLSEASFVNLPKVKEIHLVENRITEILFGAFHRLPELKKLNINKNLIRFIHPESFLHDEPSGLEELLLVDNRIGHVKELRSLLDSLPRLLFLDVSFNNLKSVPFGVLRGHPTLEQLDLSYNNIEFIEKEAFMAMPALRELRMRNNSLSELIDPPFWNLPALKGLDLSSNLFRRIRPQLFVNLPSLRRLDISRNELTLIDPETFLPVPALEHVNISHNDLEIIHPATFRPLVHLYELDASYNRLLQFVPGLPRGVENLHLHHNYIQEIPKLPSPDLDLPALKTLDLRFNRLEALHKRAFSTMPHLKKLFLSSNVLRSIDESSLYGLDRLEILDLKENNMVNIHSYVFKQMKNLKRLDLSHNQMELLRPGVLKAVFSLNHLDISRNQLSEILPHTFENNLEIESLDASNNVLVNLPKSLSALTNLKKLDLTSNRIKRIEKDSVQGLENIRELKLSHNFVEELKSETFAKMRNIKSLQLDYNDLIYIEPNSFQILPSLKSIKLNKNKIIEIPNMAFNKLVSLQVLELQDNDIRTIAPKAFNLLPQLLMLNLSNNKIHSIEDAGLRAVNSIELLDLSFNKITRLSSTVFEKMEWLVELRIDNNNICGVHGIEFVNMPRLRVLSLKDNKMTSFPEEAIQRQRGNIAVLDIDGNPLICKCNLLWLQVWLRESLQPSPRCSDGALLNEIPLAREDCRENKKLPITASPGCDTELLTSSDNVATHLASSRNNSKANLTNKNNVALTPEESDYFYNEYVDYPFNESLVEANDLNNVKNLDKDKVHLTTNVPNNISGDTPTLYAMSKNKSKTIPQRVPDSPSTSGFSFFGIPLSGISINKILHAGVSKLNNKTSQQPPQPIAERKNAIMNNPSIDLPPRSPGLAKRPIIQPSQGESHGSRNNYSPSIPEFQSGFTPMLPGSGGFKPIPNPNLTQSAKNRTVEVSQNKKIDSVQSTTSKPVQPQNKHKPNSSTVPTKSSENLTSQSVQQSDINKQTIGETKDFPKNNKGTKVIKTQMHTKSELTVLEETEYVKDPTDGVDSMQSNTKSWTAEKRQHNVSKTGDIDNSPSTQSSVLHIPTTRKSSTPLIETAVLKASAAEFPEKGASASQIQEKHLKPSSTEKVLSPFTSPIPTLLTPNVEKAQLKNAAKSTITKVSYPQLETKPKSKTNLEVAEPLPQREDRSRFSSITDTETITLKTKADNDWYFENYNKTNIEPYVTRTGYSKGSHNVGKYSTLTYFVMVLLTICQKYLTMYLM